MTTFIKVTLNKSDCPTNIDKYRVSAIITEYHMELKLTFLRIIIVKIHDDMAIILCKRNVCKNAKMDVRNFGHNYI